MADILITPAAESDLVNIWVYIAWDNSEAADRVYQVTEDTFKALAAMPRMGTLYQSRRARLNGVCFFPISNFQRHVIYYRELHQGMEIIRVLGHMDRKKSLEPEE